MSVIFCIINNDSKNMRKILMKCFVNMLEFVVYALLMTTRRCGKNTLIKQVSVLVFIQRIYVIKISAEVVKFVI